MDPKRLSQMLGFPIAQADATRFGKSQRPSGEDNSGSDYVQRTVDKGGQKGYPGESADQVEARIRAEPQPEDAFTRFSRKPDERTPSNRSLFTQGPVRPASPRRR